jgi:hypothetical protein
VVEAGDDDRECEPELDLAETRSMMSGDKDTIRVVHRAAARARWKEWQKNPSSQDSVFILETAARHAMPALCVEILEGNAVSLTGEHSYGERILSAARDSQDWRTFHVIVAMGVEVGDLMLTQLVSEDFLLAVVNEPQLVEKVWRVENERTRRSHDGDSAHAVG